MKKYSNFSKLISLLIILLSSNLNAQSTSKRGSFNFDFGIPLNNKMQMHLGESIHSKSSSKSKLFIISEFGYSHKFFRKFDYQLDLFYIKSQFTGPDYNLEPGAIYVRENVYTVFSMQDLRFGFNLIRDFNLGNKMSIGINAGFGLHILPYGWNLIVSHYYSEKQDTSIKNFRELAKNVHLNYRGYQGINYVFGCRLSRRVSKHITASFKLFFTSIEYPESGALGEYRNVYKEIAGYPPGEAGRSLTYGFQRQEIYSCTLGISYKFK